MKSRTPVFLLLIITASFLCLISCAEKVVESVPPRVEEAVETVFEFGAVETITDTAVIDIPCLVADSHLRTMHLTWLYNDTGSQRIQYARFADGEIVYTSLLSEQEGTKAGGGRLALLPGCLIAYWINIKATGGQLRYRLLSDNDDNFTRPAKLNQRNEARWPAILDINNKTTAYFFIHPSNDWELVANYDFSDEDEATIDVPMGNPFHLQGVTDSNDFVALAYFERESDSNYGRIAFLKSTDSGVTFLRKYLFDDLRINNLSSFFRLERGVEGNKKSIHVIYTEESPDLTTLYYARSDDDGDNFSIPVSIFSSEIVLARSPLLLVNGNHVLIATADAVDDGPAVRYVYSDDGGMIFSSPQIAVQGVSSPESMTGAMGDDGSVVLIWDDISMDIEGEQLYKIEGHPSR